MTILARAMAIFVTSGGLAFVPTGARAQAGQSTARAEGPRSAPKPVLVLPYQALGDGVSAELREATTAGVAKQLTQLGVKVVRASELPEPGARAGSAAARRTQVGPAADPAAQRKAEALLARGKAAMEGGDLSAAINALKGAARLLDENAETIADPRLRAEAKFQLGIAYFRDGDEAEGDDMLARVVDLDPERRLDPTAYPPAFLRVFERARAEVLRRPRGTLEVHALAGAPILLDGRSLGRGSLILKDVLPGLHDVRALPVPGASGAPSIRKVVVEAKRTASVDLTPSAARGRTEPDALATSARNALGRPQLEQLRAAGARAGADHVLLGVIARTENSYQVRGVLVAVKRGAVGRVGPSAIDLDLLSGDVEVFKIARDVRDQIAAGRLATPVEDDRVAIAPGLKVAGLPDDGQPPSVIAAPLAPPPFEAREASRVGAAPVGAPTAGPVTVQRPSASVLPKDEAPEGLALVRPRADDRAAAGGSPSDERAAGAGRLSVASAPAAVLDKDDRGTWWIWLVVGVAAAGAAAAGGYFLMNSQSPSAGNVKVSWSGP